MPRLSYLTTFVISTLGLFALPWATANSHFEIDLIFPRNETYKESDVFPIALAVQNYSALSTVGRNYTFMWYIMPYRDGRIPGGITYDIDYFDHDPKPDENDTAILVANTNVIEWMQRSNTNNQYMFRWHLTWTFSTACGIPTHRVGGEVMFDVVTDWDVEWEGEGPGVEPDVFGVLGCPLLGSVVELANATGESCPVVNDKGNKTDEGTPCAVTVNEALASSVSSLAASSARSDYLATAAVYTTEAQPSETNGAPFGNVESVVYVGSGMFWMLYCLM